MAYYAKKDALQIDMFGSEFEGLDQTNRWVIAGKYTPWAELETLYNSKLNNTKRGAANKPARMIIAACIIKHKLNLSDEETIQTIQENPYMQYFCGLKQYTNKPIFDPSLFVTIRKRLSIDDLNAMSTKLLKQQLELQKKAREKAEEKAKDEGKEPPAAPKEDPDAAEFVDSKNEKHKGILKIDGTCADAEVRYPLDVDLLHTGLKVVDRYVSTICSSLGITKMKTCFKDGRSIYLELVKRKKQQGKQMKLTMSLLLSYLHKDLRRLSDLFLQHNGARDLLKSYEQRTLSAIFTMYRQQQDMFDKNTKRCADRIISIFQPHIRPIVRGKAGRKVEFGAKIGAAVVDGYTFIDHHSWDAYNESSDLRLQIELYKERFGCLPSTILADKIYMNKENRKYLKEMEIRTYCKPLGRPSKAEKTEEELAKMAKAVGDRNEVECSFGTGKRIYRANNIRARLQDTAACWTGLCYFTKNMMKFLRELCLVLKGICRILLFITHFRPIVSYRHIPAV